MFDWGFNNQKTTPLTKESFEQSIEEAQRGKMELTPTCWICPPGVYYDGIEQDVEELLRSAER